MTYRHLCSFAVALGIAPVAPVALAGQGAFGSAIAVNGREVYVGQPNNVYGSGAANGDGFGSAIAVDGNTMLVGDAKADSESGVVLVFTRDAGGAWHESGAIKPRERHPADAFGAGVVLSGDRAYVSTGVRGFGSMVFTRKSGAVYVFRNNAGIWAAETTLTHGDTLSNPTFGNAVAAWGSRLMVGGFRADSGNGAVYVFSRDGSGAWKLDTKISPPGPITGRNSGFGSSLILRGDSAFIGALNDRGAGAVWLVARDLTSGRWRPVTW